MPSIYQLKPQFQRCLQPVLKLLHGCGVKPNHITLLALLLSITFGMLLFVYYDVKWLLLAFPLVLLLRMALNALDGMLARTFKLESRLGTFLNELGDVGSDAALYLPLAIIFNQPLLMALCVVLAIISEMAGIVALAMGASRRYDGPMGKSDRAFAFSLLAMLVYFEIIADVWLVLALIVINTLLMLTIANRVRMALRESTG